MSSTDLTLVDGDVVRITVGELEYELSVHAVSQPFAYDDTGVTLRVMSSPYPVEFRVWEEQDESDAPVAVAKGSFVSVVPEVGWL